MPWSESVLQFSAVGMVLAVLLLLYAVVGEPLLGRYAYARLDRNRDRDPRALVRFYGLTMGVQWGWAALIVAILLVSPDLPAADLGLGLPMAFGPVVAAALGFALAFGVFWVLTRGDQKPSRRRMPHLDPSYEPGGDVISRLAPHTRTERRAAAALAVTAGICEELLYRGLLTALGVGLGLPVWLAAVLSCVLFAAAHLYQGWWGLVGPGLLGALLMVLYLGTGSLLFPVLLHIAIEARSLLFTGRGRRHAGRGRRGRSGGEEPGDDYGDYEDDARYDDYDDYDERGYGDRRGDGDLYTGGDGGSGRRSDTAPDGLPLAGAGADAATRVHGAVDAPPFPDPNGSSPQGPGGGPYPPPDAPGQTAYGAAAGFPGTGPQDAPLRSEPPAGTGFPSGPQPSFGAERPGYPGAPDPGPAFPGTGPQQPYTSVPSAQAPWGPESGPQPSFGPDAPPAGRAGPQDPYGSTAGFPGTGPQDAYGAPAPTAGFPGAGAPDPYGSPGSAPGFPGAGRQEPPSGYSGPQEPPFGRVPDTAFGAPASGPQAPFSSGPDAPYGGAPSGPQAPFGAGAPGPQDTGQGFPGTGPQPPFGRGPGYGEAGSGSGYPGDPQSPYGAPPGYPGTGPQQPHRPAQDYFNPGSPSAPAWPGSADGGTGYGTGPQPPYDAAPDAPEAPYGPPPPVQWGPRPAQPHDRAWDTDDEQWPPRR